MDVGNLQTALKMDISGFTGGITAASGALDGLKATCAKVGAAMTSLMTNPVVLAAAAVAALVAVGKAAYDAFVELEAAYDAIEVGTGAVGESLAELQQSFDNVFTNATYVKGAEELAGVIADLNTYMGATGEELEGLATQFSNLEGMGMEASVDSTAKAFNRWGISNSEASGYLDYFFQLCQNTGISMDGLTDALATNQATLSTFGFSLQESAALMAKMNKAGFETSEIGVALKQLTNNGITTREAFDDVIFSIKHATDSTEALTIATQNFGARAKDSMVQLIQSGAFDTLTDDISLSAGAINATAESTADFGHRMEKVGRNIKETFAKIGAVIEVVLSKIMDIADWLRTQFEKIMAPIKKFLSKVGETFSKFWNEGENNTENAIGNIVGTLEGLFDKIGEGLDWFLETIWPVVEIYLSNFVAAIKVVTSIFAGDWDAAGQSVAKIAANMMSILFTIMNKGWDFITGGLEQFLQGIVDGIFKALNAVIGVVENTINGVVGLINSAIGGLNMLPGVNLSAIGTVNWKLDTPTVDFGSFESSWIGSAMQGTINDLNTIAAGGATLGATGAQQTTGAQTNNSATVVMNFNSPTYDYNEVTRAAEDAAQRIATSKTMQY